MYLIYVFIIFEFSYVFIILNSCIFTLFELCLLFLNMYFIQFMYLIEFMYLLFLNTCTYYF